MKENSKEKDGFNNKLRTNRRNMSEPYKIGCGESKREIELKTEKKKRDKVEKRKDKG